MRVLSRVPASESLEKTGQNPDCASVSGAPLVQHRQSRSHRAVTATRVEFAQKSKNAAMLLLSQSENGSSSVMRSAAWITSCSAIVCRTLSAVNDNAIVVPRVSMSNSMVRCSAQRTPHTPATMTPAPDCCSVSRSAAAAMIRCMTITPMAARCHRGIGIRDLGFGIRFGIRTTVTRVDLLRALCGRGPGRQLQQST